MQITGSYNNYLTMTSLLSPLGVSSASELVMDVFTSALGNLQDQIDEQSFSEESQEALSQLYSDVSSLAAKAKKLTRDDYTSVFYDRTATSSDTGVVTAEAADAFSADSGATEATYSVTVTQVAEAQENNGLDLDADAASLVDTGTSTFAVTVGGEEHELSVAVEEGDTNEEVLQKIADAINDADIGVSAAVTDGSEEGTVKLTVTADETGAANVFSIADVSGNVVAATGAAAVSTAAQDAAYSVDGVDATSSSNTVYLDDGMVTATLQGTGEADLTVAPDGEEVQDAVTGLVSGLNSLIGNLEENSDYIKDEVLATVTSFIEYHEDELASIGITLGDDGTLVVDEGLLAEAVSEDPEAIEELFGGFDGLAVQVSNYASQIATHSPLNYATEAEDISTEFADYIYNASADLLQESLLGSLLNTFA